MSMEYCSRIPDGLLNLLQLGRDPRYPRVHHEERRHQRDRQFHRPPLFNSPHVRIDHQACHYIGGSDVPERNEYQFRPLCQFHSFTRNLRRSRPRSDGRSFNGIDRITGIRSRFFAGTKRPDDDHLSGSRRIRPGMQRKRRRRHHAYYRPLLRKEIHIRTTTRICLKSPLSRISKECRAKIRQALKRSISKSDYVIISCNVFFLYREKTTKNNKEIYEERKHKDVF